MDVIITEDLYYVGELTFTPASGLLPNYSQQLQEELGSYLVLPTK